jgi:hypothetical protein
VVFSQIYSKIGAVYYVEVVHPFVVGLLVHIMYTDSTKHRPKEKEGMGKTDFWPILNPGFMTGIPVHKPLNQKSQQKSVSPFGRKLVFLSPSFSFSLCFMNILLVIYEQLNKNINIIYTPVHVSIS